jgi:segregation and condensation protein B
MPATPPNGPADSTTPRLESLLESLLLIAGGPISAAELARAVDHPQREVRAALESLRERLNGGIRLQSNGDNHQLVTAPENDDVVRRYVGTEKPPPLARSVLETLTVVAYRQPVTRAEIEAARGANSDRQVQTLLARDLIEEHGPRATIGRPMQYRTSLAFLEYFGLRSLQELPPLPEASIGDVAGDEIGLRTLQPPLAPESEDGGQVES